MARKNSCILVPEINGEASRLYKDLSLKILGLRQLVNYLYALYIQPGVAADIDTKITASGQTLRHNAQGQHYVEDVLAYFQFNNMLNEFGNLSVEEGRLRHLITDPSNALLVMQLADAFNDSHKWLVAYVTRSGGNYDVYVKRRQSGTLQHITTLKESLNVWRLYENTFRNVGIDINNVSDTIKNTVSPYQPGLAGYLYSLQNTAHRNIYRKDALVLFELGCNATWKQNLINTFGSLEAAADAVDALSHGGVAAMSVTSHQLSRLRNALTSALLFFGIDLLALRDQVDQLVQQTQLNSDEFNITKTLEDLRRQYNIDGIEELLISKDIKSLSDAAKNAIMITERRLRELRREEGYTDDVKTLMDLQKKLFSELRSRKYYSGVIDFLQLMTPVIQEVENIVANTPQNGTPLENAFNMAKTLEAFRVIYDEYHPLVDALGNTKLDIDEVITDAELDALRDIANTLNQLLEGKFMEIRNLQQETMLLLLRGIVGDTAADGSTIANILELPNKDVTFWDNNFYSMARCSNVIVAAAGDITQRAQIARNQKINDIALRLRRATDRLYKSGTKNTEFMYEFDGMGHWVIISDIDWHAYQEARSRKKSELRRQHLDSYEFMRQLQQWDEDNTEDRAVDVDPNTGAVRRTERVPNDKYRKRNPYEDLSDAEKKYYDEVMQIKGEMGSLIPDIAQHHYRPPQIYRNMIDAMSKARNAKDVLNALKRKGEKWILKMEDDTDFYENGSLVNGLMYNQAQADETGQLKKYIPIFFVNTIADKNQGELLKDFSSGLQAFAATAINYECMSKVLDVVKFMRNYVDKNMNTATTDNKADIVSDEKSLIAEIIRKAANTNTVDLLDAFINQHFFGQNIDPDQPLYKQAKLIKSLIGYTSFKGLSTNWLGATANFLVGEFQMLIEAGAGEFYNYKDYAWANSALFGKNGVAGDIAELLTNNMNHKSTLLALMFDPLQENFSDKMHTRYHYSLFRKILSHDCSMIGYGAGEHLIHYVNMYAVLHHEKVLINNKPSTLFHAFQVVDKEDGNSELKLVSNVTRMVNGVAVPITAEYLEEVKRRIKYVNLTTHGSMNIEDKGRIHQYLLGRAIMNFRQWMVEHYSRRFRSRHWDGILRAFREGYWVSAFNMYKKQRRLCNTWKDKQYLDASWRALLVGMEFIKDLFWFSSRAKVAWDTMEEDQKYNVKRALTEVRWFVGLLGLSLYLGAPGDHKKEFWRRFWMYQVQRVLLDEQTSIPGPWMLESFIKIAQSPIAATNTIQAWMYLITGLSDLGTKLKSGPNKGRDKYIVNVEKYVLPFYKHWQLFQRFGENDAIFKVFEPSPSDY